MGFTWFDMVQNMSYCSHDLDIVLIVGVAPVRKERGGTDMGNEWFKVKKECPQLPPSGLPPPSHIPEAHEGERRKRGDKITWQTDYDSRLRTKSRLSVKCKVYVHVYPRDDMRQDDMR